MCLRRCWLLYSTDICGGVHREVLVVCVTLISMAVCLRKYWLHPWCWNLIEIVSESKVAISVLKTVLINDWLCRTKHHSGWDISDKFAVRAFYLKDFWQEYLWIQCSILKVVSEHLRHREIGIFFTKTPGVYFAFQRRSIKGCPRSWALEHTSKGWHLWRMPLFI